ncbi:uncharacterized protein LOC124445157 [Xenia sp. Carnegie-2017]|uniref:uncharacterized protein LOC124445157 n=1 Tax=Xenia sp. Carnegie-2017 TaxID=2897299 RepID=UPI001F044C2F|nr:uncharacterized protein LOC124445157 [Xenia sp. Carnegie-2017]
MKAPTSVVIKGFILLVICYRNCGAYEWLQKTSKAFKLQRNDEVDFNCSLSDPTVNVTFWYKPHTPSIFKRRIPDGIYLQQFNQIFRIVKLNRSNDGDYECRAENVSTLAVLSVHYATDGLARPVPSIIRRTSVEYKQRLF